MKVNLPVLPAAADFAGRPQASSSTVIDSIGDTFARMINDVNDKQLAADRKMEEFATSGEKDIHGTMIALQKADLSLRLLLQIRAKLTAAYQELMRLQV